VRVESAFLGKSITGVLMQIDPNQVNQMSQQALAQNQNLNVVNGEEVTPAMQELNQKMFDGLMEKAMSDGQARIAEIQDSLNRMNEES